VVTVEADLDGVEARLAAGPHPALSVLTRREQEIASIAGTGRRTRDIATQLHLSVKTVEVHRTNIKTKLKLKSSPELIRFAVRWVESQNV